MRFRIVLRTAYDPQSLGVWDDHNDAVEFVRLWWLGNDVTDSHWIQGFVSISIENDEEYGL